MMWSNTALNLADSSISGRWAHLKHSPYVADLKEMLIRRRFTLPPELRRARRLTMALKTIDERWPRPSSDIPVDTERPVFLFSAGWRSGSTLMQRLIMSSGEIALWGEPLGDAATVARMGYTLAWITESWPPDHFFTGPGERAATLADQWIANLAPQMRFLRNAHRGMILEWLGVSARDEFGLARWGFKEVRLTIDYANYLKWLFPGARFIFIYRNPFHAYRSWKGNKWRSPWPGYYPRSPVAFGRHWKLLMEGFLEGAASVDGLVVKFEDLVMGRVDLQALADHLQVQAVDFRVLKKRIGTRGEGIQSPRPPLSACDRFVLRFICNPLLHRLGYTPSA